MTLLPKSFPLNFSTTTLYEAQNSTNDTNCFSTDKWILTVVPVYVLFITVLGIIFNMFVLMVFCLHKKACTVAEIYLTNLAAADLLLVSCLPFWAVYISNDFHWPFGLFLCKVVNLGIKMNFYSSIYFLVLISIDRYVALVHTMSYGRMRRPKYAKLGCFLGWSVGFLLSIPILVFRRVKPECGIHTCFMDYPDQTTELLCDGLLIVFSLIIPVFVISFCTVKIIQALKSSFMENEHSPTNERKATTLVLIVIVVFLICWVPFHLVRIVESLVRYNDLKANLNVLDSCSQIFTYFAFFNSVLNPILYVIVGNNFRKKVKDLIQRRREGSWNNTYTLSVQSKTVKSKRDTSQSTGL